MLLGGLCFLYLPLVILVVYSFNASRYVNIWQGFSTKWYRALLDNEALLDATFTSLKVAFLSANLAVILGTLLGVILVKFGAFRGKGLLKFLVMGPFVMPEVILAVAFLLIFISLEQWIGFPPGRGMTAVIVAHATIGMAYVTTVVRARLSEVDLHLVEAAQDLGATPLTAFFKIILPLILPALAGGWLLAFILSFDDLVIASFVAGASVKTLPMEIFARLKFGITPEVNVIATIMLLILFVGIGLFALFNRRTLPQDNPKD